MYKNSTFFSLSLESELWVLITRQLFHFFTFCDAFQRSLIRLDSWVRCSIRGSTTPKITSIVLVFILLFYNQIVATSSPKILVIMVASLTTPFTLFTRNIYINIFCVLEKLSLHIGSQKISMQKYPILTHLSTILTRALTVLILRSICTKHTLWFDGIIFYST